ncbi:EAL domain-containing protein [Spirulina subsalsa]|uniref:two-component system response regulator n=1 Tax=Spirulina subsalsa TaxID=54311 RepID=UPI0002F10285|nr:EAL domain-containing protein [Spirulina subsalsa]
MDSLVEEKATIFVVDDNPINLRVLLGFLKAAGFKVLVAQNGQTALQKLQSIKPDLILLDIAMPGMNGFEICRRLKDDPKTQDIPVIYLTALSDLQHKLEGLSTGAVDFICKPFQQEEVLSRLRLHLNLSRLQQKLQAQNKQLITEIAAKQAAQEQLRQLNQELEQRIGDRTQELSQALQRLQHQEEQLRYEATHDLLTGLPNRSWLLGSLERVLQEKGEDWSIFLLDLDRFKNVNERFGHFVGDQLLKQLAERIQWYLSPPESIARLGGDEFVILLRSHDNLASLENLAQILLADIQRPFNIEHYHIALNASLGIIPKVDLYPNSMELLRDADFALHHAKNYRKGSYSFLTPHLKTQTLERIQIETDLRTGLEQEQFCLHYQPIICLSTLKIVGFESLIRWHHPTKGLLFPNKFIPIAEEIGLIHKLDIWALKTASQQLQKWQQQFKNAASLTMNVNISNVHRQCLEALEQINWSDYLQEGSRAAIKLEITETGFWATTAEGMHSLRRIADLGIELCIDDFGTGYSSLSRLHNLPVTTLKIDRSFINRLDEGSESQAIVQNILTLARNLNMTVVAEGIETPAQLAQLQTMNCDLGQGYLFAKPLTLENATEFLQGTLACSLK